MSEDNIERSGGSSMDEENQAGGQENPRENNTGQYESREDSGGTMEEESISSWNNDADTRNTWREGSSSSRAHSKSESRNGYNKSGNFMKSEANSRNRARNQEGGDPGLETGSEAGSAGNYRAGIKDNLKTGNQGNYQTSGENPIQGQEMRDFQYESGAQNPEEMNAEESDPSMQSGEQSGTGEDTWEAGMESHGMEPAEGARESGNEIKAGGKMVAAQIQQYFLGVNYPAAKQDMVDMARTNNAPDEFMSFINRLPDKTYNAPMEVEDEFGKIK